MGKTERILEGVLAVLAFVLAVLSAIQAVAAFTEKTACSVVRGLLWLLSSCLWFTNGIYALIDLDVLEISVSVEKDEDLND